MKKREQALDILRQLSDLGYLSFELDTIATELNLPLQKLDTVLSRIYAETALLSAERTGNQYHLASALVGSKYEY